MKFIEPRLLKGFRDFLPEDMILRNKVISIIRKVFELHGFLPLETPTIEHLDILSGKYGEEGEKLIYKFTDHGDRQVAMRYDLTVPFARVIAQYPELPRPLRRYQIQPVWRADKPQKGRFREFYQCDCDIVGVEDITAESEIISVIYHSLIALGFKSFIIKINHREILNGLLTITGMEQKYLLPLCRSIDKLDKIGLEGVKKELLQNGFPETDSENILSILSSGGSSSPAEIDRTTVELIKNEKTLVAVKQLKKLFGLLKASGIDERFYTFDMSLARGLDYYTGTVFETIVNEPKIGSITGGGRYDELVGMFAKEKIPAVGTSLGLERIIEIVKVFNLIEAPKSVSKALIVNFSEETTEYAATIASLLRTNGIQCEIYPEPAKLAKQIKYADRLQIPYVLIGGSEEQKEKNIVVKRLNDGIQTTVKLDSIMDFFNKDLSTK
jgi:histidyl-tRNA synthetase